MDSISHTVAGTGPSDKHTASTPYDTTVDPVPARPSLSDRFRTSRLFQQILRVLQFLSALTSLILFSIRLAKIIRLVHRASHSSGAVEGILAAAVLYTLIAMAIRFLMHNKGGFASRALAWPLVALDIAFVGAFIAVAVLTNPHHGGDSAACDKVYGHLNNAIHRSTGGRASCKLPWGTFALAIVSTILHAITAIFHKTKEHYRHTPIGPEAGAATHSYA